MTDLFVSFEYDRVPPHGAAYSRGRGNCVMPVDRPILGKAEIEDMEYVIDVGRSLIHNVTVLYWRRMEEPNAEPAD